MSRSSGQLSLARPINPRTIGYVIALHGPAIALLFAVAGGFAIGEMLLHDIWGIVGFAVSALCLAVVAIASFAVVRRWPTPAQITRAEALFAVAAVFAVTAGLAAIPLAVYGLSLTDAVFEAMSGVTTTGLTVIRDVSEQPFAIVVFRALLQWFGGGLFLLSALALVLSPGRISRRLGATDLTEKTLLQSSRTRARGILTIYSALTAITVLAIFAASGDLATAVVNGLAAVSTGGFSASDQSLAGQSGITIAVTVIASLAAAISLSAFGVLRTAKWRGFFVALEFVTLIALVAGFAALVVAFEWNHATLGAAELLGHALATTASAQSTAGFSTIPIADLTPASQAALIASMMIGGDVGSTAGGLKIIRLLILIALVHLVLTRVLMPEKAVAQARVEGRVVSDVEISNVAVLIALYFAFQFTAWMMFLASGAPPLAALFDVTSALSTVGLSAGLVGPDLAAHLKWLVVVLMLAGRIELLGLALVVLPSAWRRS